ncbi:LysR family transcriptional regulator [Acidaminococcus timonensis]|jgi:DNA-binding transcriptional LysR family regulator|uniref:LysR family transcriptional regulator n=1 Tax=Acidaminococcus timonensis TaxID=1871002 RepID=UPI003A5C475A
MPGELPTIAQLECFIIYGRVGNFARAAQEAHITQSAFSAQIKHLETTLGVTLIHRSKRGSQLTEEGKLFLARTAEWMDGLRKIVYDTRCLAQSRPVELNVGILRSLGDIHMNRHIAHFRQVNPNLRFNVFDLPTYQIHEALTEGRLDVVSTYFVQESLPGREKAGAFAVTRFCTDNLVYYAPLLPVGEGPLTREQILSHPLVLYPTSYYMNRIYQEYFAGSGREPVISARLSTPYAMVHYCQENGAGALLPERLLKTLGHHRGWHRLQVPLQADGYLIYRKDSPKAPFLRIYVNQVLSSFHGKEPPAIQ